MLVFRTCCTAIRLTRTRTRFLQTRTKFIKHRVESQPKVFLKPPSARSIFTMSLDSVIQSLAALSINAVGTATHVAADSPTAWRDALTANPSSPKSFELLKTLVYKPKTAKTAVPVPVVVILQDGTEANSTALGKKLNLKELRLASEDLLMEFFSLDMHSRMCYKLCGCFFFSGLKPHR
jgi:hypothetical protein